jgi:hypothetical protein
MPRAIWSLAGLLLVWGTSLPPAVVGRLSHSPVVLWPETPAPAEGSPSTALSDSPEN